MKKITSKLTGAFVVLLLFAAAVTTAGAQEKPADAIGVRRDAGVFLEVEEANKSPGLKALQELALRPPEQSIVVAVRYPTRYGYAGRGNAFGGADPNSCQAFSVQPTVAGDTRPRTLISVSVPQTMRQTGDMYVCEYLIGALPFDQPISVGVTIGTARNPSTEAWMEGSEAQPPEGQRRIVVDGNRKVTLTAGTPRAALAFEMVYAPLRIDALPLQQPSPWLRPVPRIDDMRQVEWMRAIERAQEVEPPAIQGEP